MKYLVTTLFILAGFVPQFAHADITSNLAAWWKYDEGTGTTAADSTGSGHTGTLNGVAGWTSSSKIGPYAVTTDGSTSGNGISVSSTISVAPPFTFAEWIYPTIAADAAFRNLFSQTGAKGYWWRFGVVAPFGSGFSGTSNTSISQNTWHHIAIVADASGNVIYYLDGVADGTGTASAFTVDGMGCDSGSGAECFTGRFDDARYYTRALSSSDIAELYAYPPLSPSFTSFVVRLGTTFRVMLGTAFRTN